MRFTYRQQEFARFYATGMPASRAAHYAGYAHSTAETNAARLLAQPAVQSYVAHLRHARFHTPADEYTLVTNRLRHIIANCTIEATAIRAINTLRAYQAAHARHDATLHMRDAHADWFMPQEDDEWDGVHNIDGLDATPTSSLATDNKNTDNQAKEQIQKSLTSKM